MPADLTAYFDGLIKKVEASDLSNAGKDKDGFYKPTRELVLRNLHMLRDLHQKPLARAMVKDAWKFVAEHLPPEMLVLSDEEKVRLKEILK